MAALTAGIATALATGLISTRSHHSTQSRHSPALAATATPSTRSASALAAVPDPGGPASSSAAPPAPSATVISDIQTSGSLLVIPAINVRAPLVPTGATGAPETASLTIPADIHTVGWWDGTVQDGGRTIQENAPAPGQPGVALIAGHVDSAVTGPGALHDLRKLRVGDTIEISDSSGHISAWTVDTEPQTNLKTQLPPALWVTTGPPRLALVTCGGPFNLTTGHYQDNVIVWAQQSN